MSYPKIKDINDGKSTEVDLRSPSVNAGEKINIKNIEEEYKPDNSIFSEEGNLTHQIKNIIFNELSITERWILLLYAEEKSLRKTGKILNISTSTAFNVIHSIREKIKKILNNANNN